jgi:hypothetical protein
MTDTPYLFRQMKTCCVCGCQAQAWRKRSIEGEPNIIAISSSLYRRGSGKGQQKAAPAVQICEPCFVKAITGFGTLVRMAAGRDLKFWNALAGALSDRYSAMLDDDAFSQVKRPDWRNPQHTPIWGAE